MVNNLYKDYIKYKFLKNIFQWLHVGSVLIEQFINIKIYYIFMFSIINNTLESFNDKL